MNKNILKKIAKRYAKALVQECADVAFDDTELTFEEKQYIVSCMKKIGNRITKDDTLPSTRLLVLDYYPFE